jgi:hypothetical protein
MSDFTIKVFNKLLEAIQAKGYTFQTYTGFLQSPASKAIILRHDVDDHPDKALEFANNDKVSGIQATYYFRAKDRIFKSGIIDRVAALGHEIGYHYEDLTACHGNPEKAIASFMRNLAKFRSFFPVRTICMDGRPLSIYNNLDLWKHYNYRDYGIVGEPFLDIDFNKVLYLTDTGRGWNMVKYSVRDKVYDNFHYYNKTTKQLIRDIQQGNLPDQIMLNVHPQRWHSKPLPWLRELLLQRMKNMVKWVLIRLRKADE